MKVTSPKTIKALLDGNGLAPLKQFGQNFLMDENIVRKIADASVAPPSAPVLEVGMGLGALTTRLAKRAGRVVTVEIDHGLAALSDKLLKNYDNVTVLEDDILEVDIAGLAGAYFDGNAFCACGNLPYYITSKILLHLFESGAPLTQAVFMMQKEVARRLAARPGDTDYGALTASLLYYARPEPLFDVSRHCFYPAPEVDSAVVRFVFTPGAFHVPRALYAKTVRAAFAMRRKTISNNLKQIAAGAAVTEALARAGVDAAARAQDVSPQQFASIAEALGGEMKF